MGRSPKQGEGGSPTLSPGTDAGRVCTRALQDAKPTKHTQPFAVGKGFGVRDNRFAVYLKINLNNDYDFSQIEVKIFACFFTHDSV